MPSCRRHTEIFLYAVSQRSPVYDNQTLGDIAHASSLSYEPTNSKASNQAGDPSSSSALVLALHSQTVQTGWRAGQVKFCMHLPSYTHTHSHVSILCTMTCKTDGTGHLVVKDNATRPHSDFFKWSYLKYFV